MKKICGLAFIVLFCILLAAFLVGLRSQPAKSSVNLVDFDDDDIRLPMAVVQYGALIAPTLNAISNPGGASSFLVSWNAVQGAEAYVLQEDDNAGFSSPGEAYNGANTSVQVSVLSKGTYYYRVKSTSGSRSSNWSNVQSVVVTAIPPACPTTGSWSGSGYRFSMDFQVIWDGSQCIFRPISHGHLFATCHIPMGSTWTTSVEFILQEAVIQNYHFETTTSDLSTTVSGDFTSANSVSGDVSYYYYEFSSNATCRLDVSWSGSP